MGILFRYLYILNQPSFEYVQYMTMIFTQPTHLRVCANLFSPSAPSLQPGACSRGTSAEGVDCFFFRFLSYLRSPGRCRFLSRRELLFAQEVGTQFGGLQVYLCICTCVFVFVYLQLRRFSIRTNTFWKFVNKRKRKSLCGDDVGLCKFLLFWADTSCYHVPNPDSFRNGKQNWKLNMNIEFQILKGEKPNIGKRKFTNATLDLFLEQWKKPWKDNSIKCASIKGYGQM